MNEDEEFIIEEDIDFDEEYSELEIKKNQYSFQQIKDICLTNPLYKRRYFRDNSENILNICYNCQNFQAIQCPINQTFCQKEISIFLYSTYGNCIQSTHRRET